MPRRSRSDVALEFRKSHLGWRPPALRDSTKRRARKAKARFDPDGKDGLFYRLSRVLAAPRLYVFHAAHLGLSKQAQHADGIYNPTTLEVWREAVKLRVEPPFFGQFELDCLGLLHCHVIADADAVLELEGVSLTDWRGWAAYLAKPHDARASQSWAVRLEAEGAYIEAQKQAKRQGKRLPKRSFFQGIPKAV